MNRFEKFLESARRGRREVAAEARPGLGTRVAARWATQGEEDPWLLWERVAKWGLSAACGACLIALAVIQTLPERSSSAFEELAVPQLPAISFW